jgi:hypothetical protein
MDGADASLHSPYSPDISGGGRSGEGRVCIQRRMEQPGRDGQMQQSFEMLLMSDHFPSVRKGDLIKLSAMIRNQFVELQAQVVAVPDQQGVRSSLELVTHPQSLPERILVVMVGRGEELSGIRWETVASRKTPYDLHGLGILGLRTLLCGVPSSLAQARRHLNDFIATLAPPTPGRPVLNCLLESIRTSLTDPSGAWLTRVGPAACFDPELVSRAGPDLAAPIPDDVWTRILATMVRMLSSDRNPYAAFPDLGEIGERPMHAVFDESLDLLADAMRRIRCMLLAEHALNREVRAAIARARGVI